MTDRDFSTNVLRSILAEIGPDPAEDLPRAPDFQAWFVHQKKERLQRAERLLSEALEDLSASALGAFTGCFDEDYYRYLLFHPLRDRWKAGMFADRQWGGALRGLLTSGHTTSGLIGVVSKEDAVAALLEVPSSAVMLPTELHQLHALSLCVVCYRAGWAQSPTELAARGLSWTLRKNVADQFLRFNMSERMEAQQPYMLEATIERESILCYFATDEDELIVRPGFLRDLRALPLGQ